jgi:tRNA threonylcarbamoyladenosine biosynthesis protein TsaB
VTVLAIETATLDVGVALCSAEGPLAVFAERGTRRHVEVLHPTIERLLREQGLRLRDLEAIAVDLGPGLFTGLRVGIAAAKTLACSLELALIGVSSLEILAVAAGGGPRVVPVVDLRRGEVAWSIEGAAPRHGPVEALCAELASIGPTGAAFQLVGDGAIRYAAQLTAGRARIADSLVIGGAEFAAPPPAVLGAIALERLRAGSRDDPYAALPIYLRDADARANFATRAATVVR